MNRGPSRGRVVASSLRRAACALGSFGILLTGPALAAAAPPTLLDATSVSRVPDAPSQVVAVDLTPDGFDRYDFVHSRRTGPGGRVGSTVTVTAPPTNSGVNLRSAWWIEGVLPTVDHESCVTWSEYSGPIVQAGVALRVRKVGDRTQAVTVTNNIMWGARNGWNVHLWNGTGGDLIGQVVLSHSFGSTVFTQPPLPWRLCARVVGTTLEFKAWSLAVQPDEPSWSDPGYGTSFRLPRGWVYPGYGGWYVGHLQPGDSTVYRSLSSEAVWVRPFELVAISIQTGSDVLQRRAAVDLVAAVQSPAA